MLCVTSTLEGGIVKRFSTFVAASVWTVIAVGMLAGSLFAQSSPGVYAACGTDQREIKAADLPAVVDQDRCPVGGREIVDGGISVVVPEPGESVFAEAMSPRGSEHLEISNPPDDTLVLGDGRGPGDEDALDAVFRTWSV